MKPRPRKRYYRPSIAPELEQDIKIAAAKLGVNDREFATAAMEIALKSMDAVHFHLERTLDE